MRTYALASEIGQPEARVRFRSIGGDEALEFVEPILDEDYLGWELRTQHQEPTVGSQS